MIYRQLSLVDSTSCVTTPTSRCGQDDRSLEKKDRKGEVLCFFVFSRMLKASRQDHSGGRNVNRGDVKERVGVTGMPVNPWSRQLA